MLSQFFERIEIKTDKHTKLCDITNDIAGIIERSGIREGNIIIQSNHTTAGLLLNEYENGLLKDFENFLDRHAPRLNGYVHDDILKRKNCPEDEPINAHSHIKSALFTNPSVSLVLHDGRLQLGRWQRIIFCEFDGPCPRKNKDKRSCSVQIIGVR